MTELLSASKAALEVLKGFINGLGGCDHQVGICVCSEIRAAHDVEEAIERASVEGATINGKFAKLHKENMELRVILANMMSIFGNPKPDEYVDGGTSYRVVKMIVDEAAGVLQKPREK